MGNWDCVSVMRERDGTERSRAKGQAIIKGMEGCIMDGWGMCDGDAGVMGRQKEDIQK